jgi:drug/metabolite transporter (DMT)-like permease
MSNRLTRVDLLLLLMIAFWGANITIIKVALRNINPMAFNCIRFLVASAAFCVIYRRVFRDRVSGGELVRLALLGILGNTCYQLLFIHGVEYSHVSHTSILLGVTPIFTAFLSSILGHETVTPRLWFGVLLSFCGVGLIVFGKHGFELGDSRMLLGDFFVVLASLIWAVYTTFSRDILARYSSGHYVLYTVLFGTLALVPVSIPGMMRQDWSLLGWFELGALAYASVLALVFGYSAWYYGVERLGSTRTSAYGNLTPVAGLAIGMIFLGERLSPLQWLGALVIFTGITLNRFARIPKPAAVAQPGGSTPARPAQNS